MLIVLVINIVIMCGIGVGYCVFVEFIFEKIIVGFGLISLYFYVYFREGLFGYGSW